jgi:hypothetical protein
MTSGRLTCRCNLTRKPGKHSKFGGQYQLIQDALSNLSLDMKPLQHSVAPLLLGLSLIGGCTSPAPHSADTNLYELTARFLSREGRLYMEITACVRVDEPFWVHGKDGVGRWVQLSGRLRQRDATVFRWEHLHFVAHSPASEDAPLEAFDWKGELDLKLGEASGGGAIHGPRHEIILRRPEQARLLTEGKHQIRTPGHHCPL